MFTTLLILFWGWMKKIFIIQMKWWIHQIHIPLMKMRTMEALRWLILIRQKMFSIFRETQNERKWESIHSMARKKRIILEAKSINFNFVSLCNINIEFMTFCATDFNFITRASFFELKKKYEKYGWLSFHFGFFCQTTTTA
jgi:hypothetical protein